ncbi:MAG: MerR family transcriptional regulator [Yaniella sp.]|uniref:MerR family transcriptional regulator n=1 Tax=Yaniella sp. TaxID=2773929 RepID=UPI002647F3DE|nr:MerR family transcriptional regulator [Yaniella sp.]MDN5732039.1 MerR family transcriptional regulator [Yaniella sp.]
MSERHGEEQQATFGLAELAERSGVAVRNIRFYTTQGLLAAPGKHGRRAVYTSQHLVTLELIAELQGHGFGLAAIKEHLHRIPVDASVTSIAMHSTMLAPWLANRPATMTRAELDTRTDRPLTDDDLTMLKHLGVIHRLSEDAEPARYAVATALLSIGVDLIDFGLTPTTSAEITKAIETAGQRLTADLEETYSRMLKPRLADQNMTDSDVERFVSLFKPVSIAALARSYEHALGALRQRESEAAQTRLQTRAQAHHPAT